MNSFSANLGITLLRVSMGMMWVAHALVKILIFTPAGTVGFFTSIGLPGFLAYVVIALELIGGVSLILGIYARQFSLILIPVAAGATWAHLGNGWLFSAPNGGWEYPALLTIISVSLWLAGDGALTLKKSKFLAP